MRTLPFLIVAMSLADCCAIGSNGHCVAVCGNGFCELGEGAATCALDCP